MTSDAHNGIRVVFLDIDDTLLGFSGCVREVMREGFPALGLGVYSDEMYDVFERVNGGLWRAIERGEITLPQLEQVRWDRIFRELGLAGDGLAFERFFKERLFQSAILVPGADALVRHLRGRYVLCAASNGPYAQQVNRLRVAGLLDAFDRVFISERLGAEKPSRAFFDRCFEELREGLCPGLLPAEAVIVGDSMTSDVAGGAAYGMRTCLYHPGWDGAEGERPAGVDLVVSDLSQLEGIL